MTLELTIAPNMKRKIAGKTSPLFPAFPGVGICFIAQSGAASGEKPGLTGMSIQSLSHGWDIMHSSLSGDFVWLELT